MNRLQLEFDADAIALAEFSTIPTGLIAADAATKAAEIDLLFAGSVHPGKFLIALQGGVSETELALKAALDVGRQTLIDAIHIPFPHPQLRRLETLQLTLGLWGPNEGVGQHARSSGRGRGCAGPRGGR